jgi:hypothetical protein
LKEEEGKMFGLLIRATLFLLDPAPRAIQSAPRADITESEVILLALLRRARYFLRRAQLSQKRMDSFPT